MDIFRDKGLSFERLKTLVKVRECGGIARAAPGDVTRQNLIGRQLRDLEEFFGAKLTTKQGKMVSLSNSGTELAAIASQVLTLVSDFKSSVRQKRKLFRVGAGGTVYAEIVAPRLASLRALKLEVHLSEIIEKKIFQALQDGRIDCAIAWATPPPALKLQSTPVGELEYALYGEKSLFTRGSDHQDYLSLPFVVVRHRDMTQDVESRLHSEEIIHVDENIPALRIVGGGQYVAILPTLLGSQLPTNRFRSVDLPFLKGYRRKIRFYWSPRGASLRGFSSSWMEQIAAKFEK